MNKNNDILDDEEALKRESPILHSISRENRFSVPDGYFDSLPSKVLEKCAQSSVVSRQPVLTESSGWSVWQNLKSYFLNLKYIAGAASFAVICFFIFRGNDKPVSYEALAQNIPDSAIVANLDNNIADINVSTLEDYQVYDNETAFDKNDTASKNDEEIISYLLDHNVDESDIVNQPSKYND